MEDLLEEFPEDAESWAMLGRMEKDAWVDFGAAQAKQPKQCGGKRQEEGMLREAINAYATGFRKDPTHYYSGINAVTLLYLQTDLTITMSGRACAQRWKAACAGRCVARWRRTKRTIGRGSPWRSWKFW